MAYGDENCKCTRVYHCGCHDHPDALTQIEPQLIEQSRQLAVMEAEQAAQRRRAATEWCVRRLPLPLAIALILFQSHARWLFGDGGFVIALVWVSVMALLPLLARFPQHLVERAIELIIPAVAAVLAIVFRDAITSTFGVIGVYSVLFTAVSFTLFRLRAWRWLSARQRRRTAEQAKQPVITQTAPDRRALARVSHAPVMPQLPSWRDKAPVLAFSDWRQQSRPAPTDRRQEVA
jgi:membrane protein YdbS with pleckstrin-like domain